MRKLTSKRIKTDALFSLTVFLIHNMRFYKIRYITIGQISQTLIVVVVVYTERECSLRIISARLATKSEMEGYYGDCNRRH